MRARLAPEVARTFAAAMPQRLASLLIGLALAAVNGVRAQPTPVPLQLVIVPVVVNGTPREPVKILLGEGQRIWMTLPDLERIGMVPGTLSQLTERVVGGVAYVELGAATQFLSYRFDEAQLALTLDLQPDFMARNELSLSSGDAARLRMAGTRYASAAYLNYAVSGTRQGQPSVFLEAVGSMEGNSLVANLIRDAQGRTYRGTVSGMFNDEAELRQIVIGDGLWPGAGLLGSVAIGGVVAQTFFGYEPGFVATPTLGVQGVASTPSTVDVLVNGTLVTQRQIPAGPFELTNLLAQAGLNNVTAVVRDAFGRETRFNQGSFYGSPALLRPGLSTYSVAAGRIRAEQPGQGPQYGDTVLLAQAARGFADALTLGVAAQASARANAVAGQLAKTGEWGEAGLQAARSAGERGSGLALNLSYSLSRPDWAVSVSSTRRSRLFGDVTTAALLPERILRSDDAFVGRRWLGVDWGLRWTVSNLANGVTTRRIGLSLARRWSDQVGTSVELARTTGSAPDTSIFFLLSYSLDAAQSVSLASNRSGGRNTINLDVFKSQQEALSTGYRLSNSWTPEGGRQTVQFSRDTRFGDYFVQLSRSDGQTQSSWRASGAVAAVDGTLALSVPIRDAFVLVRVPDAPEVPVLVEGRFAGTTDAAGTLLVSGLSSYSGQRVSIDPAALPLDYQVGLIEKRVRAPLRGAAVTAFEVSVYRAVLGRILDAGGKPVANGIVLLGDGRRIATGGNGDFVIEGEAPAGQVAVQLPGTAEATCRVLFPATAGDEGPVRRLGALRCQP